MKKIMMGVAALVVSAGAALADPVEGRWRSPTSEGKSLVVNIVPCSSGICGVVDSVSSNSDQGIVGKTMIWGMQPQGGGKYSGGKVWAPDQDKTYNGKLTLNGNTLKIQGCVFGICRGETFTR